MITFAGSDTEVKTQLLYISQRTQSRYNEEHNLVNKFSLTWGQIKPPIN